MGYYCQSCGSKLNEQSNFCSHCGSPVTQIQQPAVQGQNTYQNAYQKSAPVSNQILFVFITTLIFMAYFSLRTFILLVLPGTWSPFWWRIIYSVAALGTFSIALAQFIFAYISFNKRNSLEKRIVSSGKLSALSIVSFILGLVLLVCFIIGAVISGNDFVKFASFNGLRAAEELFIFMSAFLVFDIAFFVFATLNMIKTKRFKEEISELRQDDDDDDDEII